MFVSFMGDWFVIATIVGLPRSGSLLRKRPVPAHRFNQWLPRKNRSRSQPPWLCWTRRPVLRQSLPRHRHRRAKVNYFACVRTETFGDDVVPCIDMSRGGVSFKTRHPYPVSSLIHIAVPFARESPQAPAIFFPGRIANINPIPDSDLFRCGVAFMPLR